MTQTLADFIALIAAPKRAPVGIAAAAAGAAMGLALMERALAFPPEDAVPGEAAQAAEIIASLRRRIQDLIETNMTAAEGLETALADTSEDADAIQAGARVPAYRAARRLVDFSIQGLMQLKPTLDSGSRVGLADLETAWRLLETALEAGIAACEQHLNGLSSFFADSERPALLAQSVQGREWVQRASGDLSWRLGRQ